MQPYFEYKDRDRAFYRMHIQTEIPDEIYDIHAYTNLPEHVAMVPAERLESDWALECGHVLPARDAYACANEFFPDTAYRIAGFPWPIRETDLHGNNRIPLERVLYGSDMPITFWRGKQEWTAREYTVLSSGNYSWNTKRRSAGEEEASYTIYIYEEMRAILDSAKRFGIGEAARKDLFFGNAVLLLGPHSDHTSFWSEHSQ